MTKSNDTMPLFWVPTSYFTMAVAYMTLTSVSAIMFKNMGMDNATAAEYASYLLLAYTIKPLFAPFVEMYRTKKFFVVASQFVLSAGFALVGFSLSVPNFVIVVMVVFWVMSFIGAIQDIAADGVYVTTLKASEQAKYCGVQSLSWSIGPIVATGLMVSLSGYLHDYFGHDAAKTGRDWIDAWRVVFFIFSGMTLLMALYHWKVLPEGAKAQHTPDSPTDAVRTLLKTFITFFQKKDIWLLIAFAFLYRLSQGLLDKIGPFFMMDSVETGGLALSNMQLGAINGTYGFIAFLAGSLIGGAFVARRGLKSTLFILCCAINIPNITYLVLSIYLPEQYWLIAGVVGVEKFFFGFGAVGHMIYMMQQLAPGPFKTAHYAFGTGLMGLCMMLTGLVSGHIQVAMGYTEYFIFVLFATIPSFLICWFAPFNIDPEHEEESLQQSSV